MGRGGKYTVDKLNAEQLADLRRKIDSMKLHELENYYRVIYTTCEYRVMRVPQPESIQTLVQVWRRMWKLRGMIQHNTVH
jgi:hypothetical protein